jgi:hypothetical protein
MIALRIAAMLVPRERRADWFAEWTSELWYVRRECDGRTALWFSLGAFRDALWLRCNRCRRVRGPHNRMQSPLTCLLSLAAMAALAVAFFLRTGGPFDTILRAGRDHPPIFTHLLMVAVAFLVMSPITSLSLGEYPSTRSSPAHARRFHRWTFLGLKFGLIVPIVFCGAFDMATILSVFFLPQAALAGYVIAFRWVLNDQRRRCPVCLRVLAKSASIGEFSHNFLEWYGTELFCAKGHGLLHVPKIATTYSTQRWLDLDRSWSVLFS